MTDEAAAREARAAACLLEPAMAKSKQSATATAKPPTRSYLSSREREIQHMAIRAYELIAPALANDTDQLQSVFELAYYRYSLLARIELGTSLRYGVNVDVPTYPDDAPEISPEAT